MIYIRNGKHKLMGKPANMITVSVRMCAIPIRDDAARKRPTSAQSGVKLSYRKKSILS